MKGDFPFEASVVPAGDVPGGLRLLGLGDGAVIEKDDDQFMFEFVCLTITDLKIGVSLLMFMEESERCSLEQPEMKIELEMGKYATTRRLVQTSARYG
jgi:hypothetical protein